MSQNDITGDDIQTKASTQSYRDGWEKIWGKKKEPAMEEINRIIARAEFEEKKTVWERAEQLRKDAAGYHELLGKISKLRDERIREGFAPSRVYLGAWETEIVDHHFLKNFKGFERLDSVRHGRFKLMGLDIYWVGTKEHLFVA